MSKIVDLVVPKDTTLTLKECIEILLERNAEIDLDKEPMDVALLIALPKNKELEYTFQYIAGSNNVDMFVIGGLLSSCLHIFNMCQAPVVEHYIDGDD